MEIVKNITNMLSRDVTLNCILCRLELPIEIRFIVTENYFPFLPNESQPLTMKHILDLLLNRHDEINETAINIPRIYHIIPDLIYDKSQAYSLYPTNGGNNPNILEFWIVYGDINFSKIHYAIRPPRGHPHYEMDTFFCELVDIKNIQEETVEHITKWYRKKMLHVIDKNMPETIMNWIEWMRQK